MDPPLFCLSRLSQANARALLAAGFTTAKEVKSNGLTPKGSARARFLKEMAQAASLGQLGSLKV